MKFRGLFSKFIVSGFFFLLLTPSLLAVPTVWIDDDYNSLTPGWGITHFDNVTSGIVNVDSGGTVNVAAGTYTEDLGINKSLTMDGESRQTVILQPVGAQMDPYFWAPTHILINADNVTIQNVQLSGDESVCDEAIMIQDCNNVTIQFCDIHNYNSDAIYSLDTTATNNLNINILNNNIYHIRENNNNIGWNTTVISFEDTGGTISGNTITSCTVRYAIMNWIDDGYPNLAVPPVISNNTIESIYEPLTGGVLKSTRAITAGDPATITNNIIRNCNYGIQVELVLTGSAAYDGDITIQNNEIYDLRPSEEPGNKRSVGLYVNSIVNQAARNVLVADNILDGISGDPALGVGLLARNATAGNITWRNNTVEGFGVGADLRQNTTASLFDSNNFNLDPGDNSITSDQLGIRIRETSSLTVQNNSLIGFDYGILLTDGSTLAISGSTIDSQASGIRVINNATLASATENFIASTSGNAILVEVDLNPGNVGTVFNNDLSNFSGLSVNNTTGVNIDVSGNWFGTSSSAGVNGSVSANVDYSPWLVVSTDTSVNPGFQGDFSSLSVDDDSPQTGALAYISEAVADLNFP